MRWVVGIDLRPLSAEAIRFCTWLRETSRARDGEVFLAVHVLEQRAARRDGKGIVRLGRVARRANAVEPRRLSSGSGCNRWLNCSREVAHGSKRANR